MNDSSMNASERVAELRRAFDGSFAALPASHREETDDLLCFRVRGDPYALRVREIAGVAPAGRVVPLPSRTPELLGVVGHRGSIVPVYSLVGLLGYGPERDAPRWLALVEDRDPLALAIGELEGFRRVPRGDLHVPGREPGKHVDQFARSGPVVRAILKVASIVAVVREGAASAQPGGRP